MEPRIMSNNLTNLNKSNSKRYRKTGIKASQVRINLNLISFIRIKLNKTSLNPCKVISLKIPNSMQLTVLERKIRQCWKAIIKTNLHRAEFNSPRLMLPTTKSCLTKTRLVWDRENRHFRTQREKSSKVSKMSFSVNGYYCFTNIINKYK